MQLGQLLSGEMDSASITEVIVYYSFIIFIYYSFIIIIYLWLLY